MKLKDIIELAYYRSDEALEDREIGIDKIIINAINQGAGLISTTLQKKTKTATLTYSANLQLPTDFYSLVELKHSTYGKLASTDYEIAGDLIIHKVASITSGDFTLTYIFVPVAVTVETTDIPLKDIYCITLAAFASYQYLLSQKQYDSARMLLSEFNMMLGKGENTNEA